MMSLSGVTGASDQNLQSRLVNKVLEIVLTMFWRVANKWRQIFAEKYNFPMKNPTTTVASDLNQVKKARTLL